MKKTALHGEHIRLGAKMTEYAGFDMPVSYSSLKEEHHAVRKQAGVFDVSHMGEIVVLGKEATDFVDYIFTNNVRKMTAKQILYGFMCYEDGGVVDDFLVYKHNDQHYLLVVNAANTDKDFAWLQKQNTFDATVLNKTEEYSEIALQGPKAEEILQRYTETNLKDIRFFTFDEIVVNGEEFLVSRTGYTGEDGFEIYGDHEAVRALFTRLLEENDALLPCGLGCRDTLRFEVALPLYGHEISKDITPLEAGYGFAVDLDKEDFLGKDALVEQKSEGLKRRVVGLELIDKGIIREGYEVFAGEAKVGHVTSGYLAPSLGKAVAMALVEKPHTKKGAELSVKVRKRFVRAKVRNKQFYDKRQK